MDKEKKGKKTSPLLFLLLIPGTVLADLGLMLLGAYLDGKLFSGAGAAGHGIPVFTFLSVLISAVLSIVMLILTVVLMIKSAKKNK